MTKEQKIIGIVISAVLAIAAVFGWFFPIEVPEPEPVPLAVERIGVLDVDARGITGWNGSDWTIYSDAGSSQVFAIDGATGNLDVEGDIDSEGIIDQPLETENVGVLPTIVSQAITYTAAAGGSGTVATIADGEIWFVHKVFIRTTTSFACTGDDCFIHVGDGNDADGFLAAADASIQSTFTEATGFAAGWYGIENGSGGAYTTDDGGPFVYAPSGAAETIDYLIDETDGETMSAGAATIYVIYTRIQ